MPEALSDILRVGDDRPVHFVGAAGAGMSALAQLLVGRGVRVTGCDISAATASDLLRMGVQFSAGHDPAHVEGARAVVVTSAVARAHPELERARQLGIPVVRRADALGAAVRGATVVGIAGTHGKTTTTVMATDALAAAGLDPTGITGGRVSAWGGHLWRGGDEVIVVEADEYDRSFLTLTPVVAVVTNIEADHLDVYSDVSEIRRAFEQFVQPARTVVACADNHLASRLAVPGAADVIRYGISSADARLSASNVRTEGTAQRFGVVYDSRILGELRLGVPGRHNVLNVLAAIGCGLSLGATLEEMRPGLEAFAGVERRFQRVATVAGITIVDDYAHHPTEIAATLQAARSALPTARIVAAFQPHLFSRTRDFANEFAAALTGADVVFLTEIYPAREAPIPGVTSNLIAAALSRLGRPPFWMGTKDELPSALVDHVREGDLVLTLGAGDVTLTAYALRDLLQTVRLS